MRDISFVYLFLIQHAQFDYIFFCEDFNCLHRRGADDHMVMQLRSDCAADTNCLFFYLLNIFE